MNKLIAVILLILLGPLFMLIAVAILCDTGRPILFVHRRACQPSLYYQHGFECLKFRTMLMEHNRARWSGLEPSWTLAQSDPRLTRVGAWLRRWSLDELPQLLNIVIGEMNFIGPRPMLLHQDKQLAGWQIKRREVKSGITGWAQIHGRNSIPWSERIRLDVWYVEHRSWRLDAYILWRTFIMWITGEGLYGKDGVNHDFA